MYAHNGQLYIHVLYTFTRVNLICTIAQHTCQGRRDGGEVGRKGGKKGGIKGGRKSKEEGREGGREGGSIGVRGEHTSVLYRQQVQCMHITGSYMQCTLYMYCTHTLNTVRVLYM